MQPALHRIAEARRILGQFLHWWGTELAGMLPIGIRQWAARRHHWLMLQPDGDGIRVWRQRGNTIKNIARIGALSGERVRAVLHKEAAIADTIALILPEATILRRRIELPLLDTATLTQLIPNELDRFTPFTAAEAWFDWRVVGAGADAVRIQVELVIVAEQRLMPLLASISAFGLSPKFIGIEGDAEPNSFNLMRWRSMSRGPALSVRVAYGAGALLLALLLGASVSAWDLREEASLSALRQAVSAIRKDAEVGDRNRRELAVLRDRAAFLDAIQKRRLVAADLAAISRALPDDAWLHHLQITVGRIQVGGQARDAADLIQRIESQDGLRNAQFRQPVTKVANSALERFEIGIEQGGQRK